MKDVISIYKNIKISVNAEIIYNKKVSQIYEIAPINVIDKTGDIKERIYNAYYTCVKGLPETLQILALKENLNMSDIIGKLHNRAKSVQSQVLSEAIIVYANNLEEICKKSNKKITRYYIVSPVGVDINQVFKSLEDYGLTTTRITSKEKVGEIMMNCILKGVI